KKGIVLNIASADTVNFVLSVGQITETIQVIDAPPVLEANGTLLGNRPILELPINGRDYGRFSLLSPGSVNRNGRMQDVSFNGLPHTANAFTIDGVDASAIQTATMASGFERGARLLTGSLDSIVE